MEKNTEKTFEENILELERIVKELESGNVSLDDAINKYKEATVLAKKCSDKLKSAEKQVNKILLDDNTEEDFEVTK